MSPLHNNIITPPCMFFLLANVCTGKTRDMCKIYVMYVIYAKYMLDNQFSCWMTPLCQLTVAAWRPSHKSAAYQTTCPSPYLSNVHPYHSQTFINLHSRLPAHCHICPSTSFHFQKLFSFATRSFRMKVTFLGMLIGKESVWEKCGNKISLLFLFEFN